MDGIKEIIWFFHRKIFELVPALLASVVIYFFIFGSIERNNIKNLEHLNRLSEFFGGAGNSIFGAILIFSGVVLMSLFIRVFSNLLQWTTSEAKKNLELYPSYIRFKEKIDEELSSEFGDGFSFNAREIQNFMRYKIMEEHKEFDTYLWYKATEFDFAKQVAVAAMLTSSLVTPFVCLKNEFILWQYVLFVVLGTLPFYLNSLRVRAKIAEINKSERRVYEEENNSVDASNGKPAKFEITKIDIFLAVLVLLLGVLLNFGAGRTYNLYVSSILFIWGVNLLLLIPVHLLLIEAFLENKSFKKTLLDSYISIRYNNQLFKDK